MSTPAKLHAQFCFQVISHGLRKEGAMGEAGHLGPAGGGRVGLGEAGLGGGTVALGWGLADWLSLMSLKQLT